MQAPQPAFFIIMNQAGGELDTGQGVHTQSFKIKHFWRANVQPGKYG